MKAPRPAQQSLYNQLSGRLLASPLFPEDQKPDREARSLTEPDTFLIPFSLTTPRSSYQLTADDRHMTLF